MTFMLHWASSIWDPSTRLRCRMVMTRLSSAVVSNAMDKRGPHEIQKCENGESKAILGY